MDYSVIHICSVSKKHPLLKNCACLWDKCETIDLFNSEIFHFHAIPLTVEMFNVYYSFLLGDVKVNCETLNKTSMTMW